MMESRDLYQEDGGLMGIIENRSFILGGMIILIVAILAVVDSSIVEACLLLF